MFFKLRNNLANIAITPMLDPSVKHNCHYYHIQSFNSEALKYHFSSEVSDFATSFRTIWQLSHLLSHFALQPSSVTCTQAQIPGAWLKILLSFFAAAMCCFLCCTFFNLFKVCLHNYCHFSLMVFHGHFGVIY